ncbi:Inositol 2-dehydrogenase/D-chiro-inositol 3-dehydrogenase [bioreactor metagenome]|uniref:Inositol 2-dehydrogenase/D-chiro-inositol 3-dehydrogenase n=1 Tax=bioreactor metagenome TaxID=1076179 RepID=A0A644YC83_9ZZZZ
MNQTKIGIIGCGMISDTYFKAAQRFAMIEVAACADLKAELAREKGELYGVRALGVEELLADPGIALVLNLTPPLAHSKIAMMTLEAGKHAYSEKPFGIDLADAEQVMRLAARKHLAVGCAPDTFLGGGLQTARKLLDDGWIGKVLAGTAMVMGRGPEKWPHAPFFYDRGAGPMLDLGPYYITALVHLLGPVVSVTAVTGKSSETRIGGPETVPHEYPVKVDTHQTGILRFASGAVITMIASFDVYRHGHHPIELYGDQGSMQVPDPNTFGGPVRLFRVGYRDWQDVPLSHGYAENSRSIGAADMICALAEGRPHRASGELAFHVLEVMLAFEEASRRGETVAIRSRCDRPAALPLGLADGELD